MKIYNSIQARTMLRDYETNQLPSATVPDQSLSIAEIISRFTNGRPLPPVGLGEPIYSEDYLPDLRRYDLVDRQEIIEATNDEVKRLRNKVAELRKKKDDPQKPDNIEQTT